MFYLYFKGSQVGVYKLCCELASYPDLLESVNKIWHFSAPEDCLGFSIHCRTR